MRSEITRSGDLLDAQGRLAASGWARRPLLRYHRGRDDGLRAFAFPDFRGGVGLEGTMSLAEAPGADTMVNAIPFRRATRFVYAEKINCMAPDGRVRSGGDE